MREAFLAGRIIIGAYFLYGAIGHFTGLNTMAQYAGAKGVPLPALAVLFSGLLLGIAGVCFLLGVAPKIGVAASVLFFVPVTLMMHQFWRAPDPMARMSEMVNFTKNFALMAATLMFVAIPEPWPYSVKSRARASRLSPAAA
jgi:putative oxidoreductase